MKIKSLIYKILVTVVIVIFGSLISLKNETIKANIYENIYNNTLNLAKIKSIYTTYLGNVIPFKKIIQNKDVFNENISYKDINKFNNGFSLKLDNNYAIPIIKDGIVIFVGNKEEYNKCVIIEDEDGNDIIYGNLDKINIKLYDYVKKGDILGQAYNDTLYLTFKNGEKYLDYKEFF